MPSRSDCRIESMMPRISLRQCTRQLWAQEAGMVRWTLTAEVQEKISGREAQNWYDAEDISRFLRVRVIACYNKNQAATLDYLQQRFNQYIDLSEAGIAQMDPISFGQLQYTHLGSGTVRATTPNSNIHNQLVMNKLLIREFGTVVYQERFWLNVQELQQDNQLRPYYVQGSRERFGGRDLPPGTGKILTAQDSAGITIYDSSLNDAIAADDNGDIPSREFQSIGRNLINEEETFLYNAVVLKPIHLFFGGVDYPPPPTDHLSFYAFTYLDYEYFVEEIGVTPAEVENDSSYILNSLNTGMSRVEQDTVIGNYTTFDPIELRPTESDQGVIGYTSTLQTMGTKPPEDLTERQRTILDRVLIWLRDKGES